MRVRQWQPDTILASTTRREPGRLLRHAFYSLHDAAFRRRVIDVASPGDDFVHRAHADDFACCGRSLRNDTAPQEFADRFARAKKLARQIDRDHSVPLFERHVLGAGIALQTDVVHEEIDRAELPQPFGGHRLDLIFLAGASVKRDRSRAALPYPFHDALRSSARET